MLESGSLSPCSPFEPPIDTISWSTSRQQLIESLIQFLGYPDINSALNPIVIYTADDGGYWRKKVRYGNPEDDIVWAWLLVPKELSRPVPAVVCLPGSFMTPNWGKDGPAGLAGPWVDGQPEAYGADLARLGYIVLCPDYPCAGERTTPGLKPYDTSDLDQRHPDWTRVGLSALDVSRAVDFLLTVPEVNPDRIGCTGWSQGGQMTIIGAALEPRISAIASVCGWSPWRGLNGAILGNMMQPYNFPALSAYKKSNKTIPLDFDHIAALVAPRPFLDIHADEDDFFPNKTDIYRSHEAIGELYALFDLKKRFSALRTIGPHAFTATAAREIQAWFYRWLWTP